VSASIATVTIESHHLVRQREFSSREVDQALRLLHSEHATGKMIVNISSGAVGSIQFEERAKIAPVTK